MLALEDALIVNEQDLISRARVLGYYAKAKVRAEEKGKKNPERLKHIQWLIEHVPECTFAGSTLLSINRKTNSNAYKLIKSLWQKQVNDHPAATQIKMNFAMFLFEPEPKLCKQVLIGVLAESPQHPWAHRILTEFKDEPNIVESSKYDVSVKSLRGNDKKLDGMDLETLCFAGEEMPPNSAKTLENVLIQHPDDLCARAELIGYYLSRWKRQNILGFDPDRLSRLTQHLLFFINAFPGSMFLARCAFNLPEIKKTAPHEFSYLLNAWNQVLDSKVSKDPAVRAGAAAFFSHCGYTKRSSELVKTCEPFAAKRKDVTFILTYALKQGKTRRKNFFVTEEMQTALDEIAFDSGQSPTSATLHPYSFQEWATEPELCSAHLHGCYLWVSKESLANRNTQIDSNNIDIYNRAAIIGCAAPENAEARIKHKTWFLKNLPENRFVTAFGYSEVRSATLLALKKNHGDENVLVNIISAMRFDAPDEGRQQLKVLRKFIEPDWQVQLSSLLNEDVPETDADRELTTYKFVAGNRKYLFEQIASNLNLSRESNYGRRLPIRTIWSMERAIERNPNDLIIRAQLIEAYTQRDQWHVHFGGFTPDVVPHLIRHNLWFIENLPSYRIYTRGNDLSLSMGAKRKFLHKQSILIEAARRQMKAYPEDLPLNLALIQYFPLGWEHEALAILKPLKKKHPRNAHLEERIAHLNSLLEIRSHRRK